MALIALAFGLLYYALVLVVPLVMTRRRTGASALRGTPGVGRLIQLLFVVANLLILAGPAVDLAGGLHRLHVAGTPILQALGIALAAPAFPLIIQSRRTMGPSWRVGVDPNERTQLVTHGIFERVRHPIYGAMVTLAAGVFLMVPNVVSLAAAVSFWVAVELQTRMLEDPYLRRTHEGYAEYAARTGRFIPGVGRLSGRR